MLYSIELKDKANQLFWYFEYALFQNIGNYPRKTNLVLEFYDFVSSSTQNDLEAIIPFSSEEEYLELKKMIMQGIDFWLDAGELKTLLLSS